MPLCRRLVLEERMNPLGIDQQRIVVAECPSSGGFMGMGQLVPIGPGASEIRSLVVAQQHRGKGVGSALVQHLCAGVQGEVFLTTIGTRARFYQRIGFEQIELSQTPKEMVFEALAGTVVARLLANDKLVVMQRCTAQ